tara:strand:+ start:17264 stop:18439 length:1176 start_codon:yes stop_codon:yes gene_type:complete
VDKSSKNLFNNTELAFTNKSNFDLRKAYFLFSVLDYPWLTKIGNMFLLLVLKLRLPFKTIIKKTIFEHFCGGETIDDCKSTFDSLKAYKIYAMPEYSVEAESTFEGFENYKNTMIELINNLGNQGLPFIAIKCTGLIDIHSLEMISKGSLDNNSEKFIDFKNRMNDLCKAASKCNVKILIDAEESWIQDAIDMVALDLMEIYNKKVHTIFLTHQCYRTGTLSKIKENFKRAKQNKFLLGIKLVRGAYMEKERERAKKYNYESPIQPTKSDTDLEFDNSVKFCIDNIDNISIWVGSHNEFSSMQLVKMMKEKKIKSNDKRIWFSQLYGMSDNISFALADMGYNVVKLIPFGPIEKTIPYLIRRANENSSVKGQSNRQFTLIKNEINRRNNIN